MNTGKIKEEFTLDEAFLMLVTLDWDNLADILKQDGDTPLDAENRAKEFRNKYRPYRSKFRNRRGSVGPSVMNEMLEQCQYKIIVKKLIK